MPVIMMMKSTDEISENTPTVIKMVDVLGGNNKSIRRINSLLYL